MAYTLADARSARLIIELLRAGETVQFRARGQSMWPAIPSGSRIEVVPGAVATLRVGHVAAFERAGHVVVHRVERVGPDGLHFGGDALGRGDGRIAPEQVLGRVRVLERRPLSVRLPRPGELTLLWRALRRRLSLLRNAH